MVVASYIPMSGSTAPICARWRVGLDSRRTGTVSRTAGGDQPRRLRVMTPVLQRVGGPTIKRRKGFRCVQVVGQIPAHSGDEVGGVRAGGQGRRGAPALQPGDRLVEHLLAPEPVRAVVAGQQAEPDGRGLNPFRAKRRHQDQVAAALGHLVPVPADHSRVHVVASESALPRYRFGVRGGKVRSAHQQCFSMAPGSTWRGRTAR